jgi:hypothetical protein
VESVTDRTFVTVRVAAALPPQPAAPAASSTRSGSRDAERVLIDGTTKLERISLRSYACQMPKRRFHC